LRWWFPVRTRAGGTNVATAIGTIMAVTTVATAAKVMVNSFTKPQDRSALNDRMVGGLAGSTA